MYFIQESIDAHAKLIFEEKCVLNDDDMCYTYTRRFTNIESLLLHFIHIDI